MYPQGVCRIRKPAYAGNGCAIFPAFDTAQLGKKIRCSAADDLFRGSLGTFREGALLRAPAQIFCFQPLTGNDIINMNGVNWVPPFFRARRLMERSFFEGAEQSLIKE